MELPKDYNAKEIEVLIVKLAKQGMSSSQIGLILRDTYGVPSTKTIVGKKIDLILKEKGVKKELPEDLFNIIKKSIQIRKHMAENKQDMTALHGLQIANSKIQKLVKYYKIKKTLPLEWKYDAKSIRLYVE